MTSYRWFTLLLVFVALLVLIACSDQSKPTETADAVSAAAATKSAPKTPQAITATQALQKMEGFAQKQWAQDAMPVHIESEPNAEDNGQDGKATVWMGVFASARKGEIRTFHWSGSLQSDAPVAGVSAAAGAMPLSRDMASQMFQSFLVKSDTDKAAVVAVQHGGQNILKKFPDQQVKYILVFDTKSNTPLCYVVYGEELKKNKGFGVINAITGDYVKGGKAG